MNRQSPIAIRVLLCLLCVALPHGAIADARSDLLLGMLSGGASYRVKVQAATTLGAIRCREAVPGLIAALNDGEPLVVAAAAAALAQIGDAAAIPALEQRLQQAGPSAVVSQLQAALRVLHALAPDLAPAARIHSAKFLIKVEAMANPAAPSIAELKDVLRDAVLKRVRRESDMIVQDDGLAPDEVRQKLRNEGLSGYILSGAVAKLERVGDRLVARISLTVSRNPDFVLVAIPQAEGGVEVFAPPGSKEERAAAARIVSEVANSLIDGVMEHLRRERREADKAR